MTNTIANVSADQLKSIIARIEKLSEEKQAIADDIKEVYAEAKSSGFAVAVIREIIKIRKLDAQEREEKEAILDTYLRAIGLLPELDGE